MYKVIDLCSGIGGFHLGFCQTGKAEVVCACDINPYSNKVYKCNFGIEPLGDLSALDTEELPACDIVTAGFPCQAFSQAGQRLGFLDTRGTLFFDVARVIADKRPKAFVLENVKALRTHDKGRTYATIMRVLEELGYSVRTEVLAAKDFGVPQLRERLFFVGFDTKQVGQCSSFVFPHGTGKATRVGDILEPEVEEKYTLSDRLWQWHRERKVKNKALGKGFGYRLFSSEDPYTATISARYGKDGGDALIEQEGANPRRLTPREVARLQGFPESFAFVCSNTQTYKQLGNSVAVPVVSAIATEVIRFLDVHSIEA